MMLGSHPQLGDGFPFYFSEIIIAQILFVDFSIFIIELLVLIELAIEYWSVNTSKSKEIANEALTLENQYKYYKPKARTYNIIGVANFYAQNFNRADEYYDKFISTAKTKVY